MMEKEESFLHCWLSNKGWLVVLICLTFFVLGVVWYVQEPYGYNLLLPLFMLAVETVHIIMAITTKGKVR